MTQAWSQNMIGFLFLDTLVDALNPSRKFKATPTGKASVQCIASAMVSQKEMDVSLKPAVEEMRRNIRKAMRQLGHGQLKSFRRRHPVEGETVITDPRSGACITVKVVDMEATFYCEVA